MCVNIYHCVIESERENEDWNGQTDRQTANEDNGIQKASWSSDGERDGATNGGMRDSKSKMQRQLEGNKEKTVE